MNSITQKTLKPEIGKASLPTTHHASPVLRSSTAEGGRLTQIAAPEWWAMAPLGERRFLGGLARMMRSARRSKSPGVAQAAVKWERALGCFIKVRLIGENRRAESRRLK
jgi:hypothetical protein